MPVMANQTTMRAEYGNLTRNPECYRLLHRIVLYHGASAPIVSREDKRRHSRQK
jgi:hypothetical protein